MFVLAWLAAAAAEAQPLIHTEPMKPFAFTPGRGIVIGDKVWSAVVLASEMKKGTQPTVVPPELAPFVQKLSKFFGYDQFEILGSATKVMDGQNEHWLVPTKNFWVCAKTTREDGGYRLNMEFFHDKRSLLKTEAMLGPKSPLFIRGPVHARGQLIFVFEVKP
jgi:hypothetical protein